MPQHGDAGFQIQLVFDFFRDIGAHAAQLFGVGAPLGMVVVGPLAVNEQVRIAYLKMDGALVEYLEIKSPQ